MTIQYTPRADALLQYMASLNFSAPQSDALNVAALLGADWYGEVPRIITANYGFDGYMGVPGLNGTDEASREAAYAYGVAWQHLDPALDAASRAYYSAVGLNGFEQVYGVAVELGDTIPVVFSHPVHGPSLTPEAFEIVLNTGEVVNPATASFLPNGEYNERQTVVLTGDWGNRLQPDDPDARYPVSVRVVATEPPLELVTADGLVAATGFEVNSHNPYVEGNGPRMVGANIDFYTDLGEGAPLWLAASNGNSGADLYGDEAQFRLRVYTSAGFSPDGIGSLLPTDFSTYFQIEAIDLQGRSVWITETGVDYAIGELGTVRVVGLADTGPAQAEYNEAYVEDHDNQYDIILAGDAAAMARLATLHMPAEGDYLPVYNPGGPGNDPASNPDVPFTVPSSPQSIEIAHVHGDNPYVTFVEVDGAVYRDPESQQPIGANWGLAVHDTATGHQVWQYADPDGKIFYASFEVSPVYHITLDAEHPATDSRPTDDQILGTAQINTVGYQGELAQYVLSFLPEGVQVADEVARRDGTDLLSSVERLAFANTDWALDISGNAGEAVALYGLLGRGPDAGGLGYWLAQTDGGATEQALVDAVMASDEFQNEYADLDDATAWVTRLYENVLQRAPDAGGLDYWVSALESGALGTHDVARLFTWSDEHVTSVVDTWADGVAYDSWVA